MLYNGFVVVDTRGEEAGFCESNYPGDAPVYGPPAPYGPFLPPSTTPKTPSPSVPSVQGGGAGQYVNADTLAAGAGVLTGILGIIGASKASKSPDASRVKAVCGRKPLFNTGGKKDAYFACADRLMNPQQPIIPQKSNTGLIIGIVAAFIIMIIILAVVVMKMKNKKAATA
jgi:hypothetical protein